jgi:predicted nucleotidyltransferase component of viral defense system
MKKPKILKNVAASVQERLKQLHRSGGEDYAQLQTRYVLERLLYRLSLSKYRESFVVKGAMLFLVWHGSPHRMTRDLDLLGFGASSIDALEKIFCEVCAVVVDDDGVVFDVSTVKGAQIRAQEAYVGVRILLRATITRSIIPIQIDIGFGDGYAVEPVEIEMSSLLDMPPAHLKAYRRETAIAEKFEALVGFGRLNSRMKDFYDFWFLAQHFDFAGQDITDSIRATFGRRDKVLPLEMPVGLTEAFSSDASRVILWRNFWQKSVKVEPMPSLSEVRECAARFLWPPALAAAKGEPFNKRWPAGGEWKD